MVLSDLEGWDGEGGGKFQREEIQVHLWVIHAAAWQKPVQHCNASILQNKIKYKIRIII